MARQKSDPSLEGHLADYLRWLLLLLALLGGIGALAFLCTKPAVSETDLGPPPGTPAPSVDPLPTQLPNP
ncbi:MAG: hypothetical protein IT577_04955 [Verrucomicrobiae bacterium]|nr:hypothetical protein [Verrucomicrobiae bacterium]